MATIRKGILGGFSGKLGNLVGSERSGNATIAQFREGDTIAWSSQTDAERTRMHALCQFLSQLPDSFITRFWPIKKRYCNSYFTAISDCYEHQPYNAPFVPFFEMVKRCKMTPVIEPLSAPWRTNGVRSLTWRRTQVVGNLSLTDIGSAVWWVPSIGLVDVIQDFGPRSAVYVPPAKASPPLGTPFYVMLFWRSADGSLTSRPYIFSGVITN